MQKRDHIVSRNESRPCAEDGRVTMYRLDGRCDTKSTQPVRVLGCGQFEVLDSMSASRCSVRFQDVNGHLDGAVSNGVQSALASPAVQSPRLSKSVGRKHHCHMAG